MIKAVYTTKSVACDWAGAVMQKLPEKRQNKAGYMASGALKHLYKKVNEKA